MSLHENIPAGIRSSHPTGYVQSGDPGAVGANRPWIDTSLGAGRWVYKVRNAADTAWEITSAGADLAGGRLTLTTGVPVTIADVIAAATIYYTPFVHDAISLYDGAAWYAMPFVETSLALAGLTAGKAYDVFGYDNAGVFAIELSAAWTDDVTRADALLRLNGRLVKNADHTRRLLGTIYATAATTTEDSAAKRYVSNLNNAVRRFMSNAAETADTWNYSIAAYRQANANAANQLDWIACVDDRDIEAHLLAGAITSAGEQDVRVGIGIDSTTVNSALTHSGQTVDSVNDEQIEARYMGYPGLGRHFAAWLEYGAGADTQTWHGDGGGAYQAGITGVVLG